MYDSVLTNYSGGCLMTDWNHVKNTTVFTDSLLLRDVKVTHDLCALASNISDYSHKCLCITHTHIHAFIQTLIVIYVIRNGMDEWTLHCSSSLP